MQVLLCQTMISMAAHLTVHVVTGIKQLEVSAQAMAAAAALAGRVALYGGAALIMDYGRDEPYPVRIPPPPLIGVARDKPHPA